HSPSGEVSNVTPERSRVGMGILRSQYLLGALVVLAAQAGLIVALLVRTGRNRDEQAFKRALLTALPYMMFLISRDGVYLDYHGSKGGQLSAPASLFLGRRVVEVMPPELAARLREAFSKVPDEPMAVEYALPMVGGLRYFEARLVRCGPDRIVSIVRDI